MAAPGYTANNLMAGTQQNISNAVNSATAGVVRLVTPATLFKRFYITELDFGQSGPPNPTDCSVQWVLEQVDATTGGTSTTTAVAQPKAGGYVTAGNIDIAVTLVRLNYTAAPTAFLQAATFYAKPINQRGAGFWQAAPGGEFWFPQLANTGPILSAYSATYASTVIGRIDFAEI